MQYPPNNKLVNKTDQGNQLALGLAVLCSGGITRPSAVQSQW